LRHGDLVHGDALDVVLKLHHGIADVVFLDPPFNLGKLYGRRSSRADSLTDAEYMDYMSRLLDACIDCLKDGGALFLYHMPKWATTFAPVLARRLSFRHWIAISMQNGFARGRRLYPAHYALLYFTKGDPRHFARPKIAPPRCRHCGGLVKDYGGYLSFVASGVNLSDVWEDLSPVRHRRNKTRSANELSPEIPRRVVAISGVPGGLFVDPFAGSGTGVVAAAEVGMAVIGCDREKASFGLIRRRLSRLASMKGTADGGQ
jgi:site-specific DNA-methyltransferase (adenine-specific)